MLIIKKGHLISGMLLAVMMSAVLVIRIRKKDVYDTKCFKVCIAFGGKKYFTKALIDTGNFLYDNVYNKPVHIVEYQIVKDILENIDYCTKAKYHIIPFHSLGCKEGCIEVVMVDFMYIYNGKNTKKTDNVLLGVYREKLSQDGAYQMLLNGMSLKD